METGKTTKRLHVRAHESTFRQMNALAGELDVPRKDLRGIAFRVIDEEKLRAAVLEEFHE